MSISKSFLKVLINRISPQLLNGRFTKILFYNNSDIFITVNDCKLFISLNSEQPFLSTCNINTSFSSYVSPFSLSFKNELLNFKIEDISLLNDDRIVMFNLKGTDDAYHTIYRHLILELFTNHPNAIITNEENIISFAYKQTDLTSSRLIRRGLKYNYPEVNFEDNPINSFNKDEKEAIYRLHDQTNRSIENIINEAYNSNTLYKTGNSYSIIPLLQKGESIIVKENDLVYSYLSKAKERRLQSKYATTVELVNSKLRSSVTLKKNLEKDLKKAQADLKYREYGDALLTNQFALPLNLGPAKVNIDGMIIEIDNSISIPLNAQKYYKKYQKAKARIKAISPLIKQVEDDIEYFSLLSEQIKLASEDDLEEIKLELINQNLLKEPKVKNKQKTKQTKKINPYFLTYKNVKIGFGRNNMQNEELTHKRANNKDYFLHIANTHGSHVIIFEENPSNDVIAFAGELTLFLSGKTDGDVIITRKKNIKKLTRPGLVSFSEYKTIHFNKVRDFKPLLKEIKSH